MFLRRTRVTQVTWGATSSVLVGISGVNLPKSPCVNPPEELYLPPHSNRPSVSGSRHTESRGKQDLLNRGSHFCSSASPPCSLSPVRYAFQDPITSLYRISLVHIDWRRKRSILSRRRCGRRRRRLRPCARPRARCRDGWHRSSRTRTSTVPRAPARCPRTRRGYSHGCR